MTDDLASVATLARWIERAHRGADLRRERLETVDQRALQWAEANGVAEVVGRSRRIPCPQCDGRHVVDLTYDRDRGAWGYDCLASGWVDFPAQQNDVVSFKVERFVKVMARALQLDPQKVKLRVANVLWELGVVNPEGPSAPWTACFCVCLDRAENMRAVVDALAKRVAKLPGLVFAPTPPPETTPLPFGHRFLRLDASYWLTEDGLGFDSRAVGLSSRRSGESAPRNPGPESAMPKTLEIAQRRSDIGLTEPTYAGEAREIFKVWPKDGPTQPSEYTIKRHLSQLEADGKWRRASQTDY